MSYTSYLKFTLVILGAYLLLFVSSCKDEDPLVMTEEENITIDPTEVVGSFFLPENSTSINNLEVQSGIYTGLVNIGQLSNEGINGSFTIQLNRGNLQIATLTNNGQPLGYSIMSPERISSLEISAETTAEVIIFLNSFIVNSSNEEFDDLSNTIRASEDFASLVEEVKSDMRDGAFDFEIDIDIYSSIISDIADRIGNVISNNPLEVLNRTIASSQSFNFQVINRRKKWLSVYVESGTSSGATDKILDFLVDNESIDPNSLDPNGLIEDGVYHMQSPNVSVYDNLFFPILELESPTLSLLPEPGDEIVKISCYGLGFNNLPDDLSSADFDRGVRSVAYSVIFDFIGPIVELTSGINGIIKAPQLRGRPPNHPIKVAFKELLTSFEGGLKSELALNILEAEQSGNLDTPFLGEAILKYTSDFLTDIENQRILLNLIKAVVPIEDIPLSVVKNILPILKSYQAAGAAIEISASLFAAVNTNWKEEFEFTLSPTSPNPSDGIFEVYPLPLDENGDIQPIEDIAIDEQAGLYYVMTLTGSIYQLDIATREFSIVMENPFFDLDSPLFGKGPLGIAINPITKELYLGCGGIGSGEIGKIIDGQFVVIASGLETGLWERMKFSPNSEILWFSEDRDNVDGSISYLTDDGEVVRNEGFTRSSGHEPSFTLNGGSIVSTRNFAEATTSIFSISPGNLEELLVINNSSDFPEGYGFGPDFGFEGRGLLPYFQEPNTEDLIFPGAYYPGIGTLSQSALFRYNTSEDSIEVLATFPRDILRPTTSQARPFQKIQMDRLGNIWIAGTGSTTSNAIVSVNNSEIYTYNSQNHNIPSDACSGLTCNSSGDDPVAELSDVEISNSGLPWLAFGQYLLYFNP